MNNERIISKHNDKQMIMLDSCWAILFIILIIYIGHKDIKIGIAFLLIVTILLIIWLEHNINTS